MYWLAIIITIVANIGYHLSQKSIDPDVNPYVSLCVTYAVALAISLLLAVATVPEHDWTASIKRANWASVTLGGVIVMLELGFLLAYRGGWDLNLAALYSNAAVAIGLVPIGWLWFAEHISASRAVGLALALCAIGLLTTRN